MLNSKRRSGVRCDNETRTKEIRVACGVSHAVQSTDNLELESFEELKFIRLEATLCSTRQGMRRLVARRRMIRKQFKAHKKEAQEPQQDRIQESGKQGHEEHFADRGYNSMSHYILVHMPIPIPREMKIPDAK